MTKAGVPSFVVTLAGFLVWSGVVLILTTNASRVGTIRVQDDTVVGLANDFLSPLWGWIIAAVAVARTASSSSGPLSGGATPAWSRSRTS